MRFLFTTLQTYESDFYGRVGEELSARGHEVAHVTVSRAAGASCGERGIDARCLLDVPIDPLEGPAAGRGAPDRGDVRPRSHIRDVYRADRPCDGTRRGLVRRAHRPALPRARARLRRGPARRASCPRSATRRSGSPRTLIGARARDPGALPALHDLPGPAAALRGHAARADRRRRTSCGALTPEEREELEAFRARVHRARAKPIRDYRRSPIEWRRVQRLRRPRPASAPREDRDNEYLRPWQLLCTNVAASGRAPRPRGPSTTTARAGAAVRLLPAARHRRLQDQAR